MLWKIVRWILLVLALLVLMAFVACFVASKRLPEGQEGDRAQALAARMEEAINLPAWKRTRAITWVFRGETRHLWDRSRHLARVSFGEGKDKTEILFHVGSRKGIAFRGGERVTGEEEKELIKKGYSRWANDSYWLNPIAKLRDKGVSLRADPKDPNALIVHFSSGGVTPGDTYRYVLGEDGRPKYWEMWVQILPVKGVQSTFEDWIQLPTGAWISTDHKLALGISVKLTEIEVAESAAALNGGEDPFAPLLAELP